MKNLKNFILVGVLIVGALFGVVTKVSAATLYLSSGADTFHIGDTFEVIMKIDSEGSGINAVQATLQYPQDILQATKIDKGESVFDFWLQDPSFSNDTGKITFAGGSTVGSVGKSLQVLRATFTVKGIGRAEFSFADAAVTASDGSGSNVLSTLHSLVVNSISKIGATGAAPASSQIQAPVQIRRQAVAASGLPVKPEVTVPFFSDPTAWYNGTDNFLAQWKLPADVSGVSAILDQNTTSGNETSQGLFESKVFPSIASDGVWYLHIRFRNNIGWGPANNYRIAVDTHPPRSFDVAVQGGNSSDNPTPTLSFDTRDPLSGLKEYQISIDNGEISTMAADKNIGTFKLLQQAPGKHRVSVRAVDNAGNSAENDLAIEVIPIASPKILFVTRDSFSDSQTGVAVKGSTTPGDDVLLTLHQQDAVAAKTSVHTDANGNWEFTFDSQLKNGSYNISAQSQDSRGALSLVVESQSITVQSQPILQLGSFKLGPGGATILLLLLLVGSFGGGIWFWRKRQEKLSLRIGFTENEVSKIFKLIMDDSKQVSEALKTPTTVDDEYAVQRLQENIKKMEAYLRRGVGKINS